MIDSGGNTPKLVISTLYEKDFNQMNFSLYKNNFYL